MREALWHDRVMPGLCAIVLCETPSVRVRDVRCSADRGRHRGAEECDEVPTVVIPYRGTFVRRIGARHHHADPNQVLFFNAGEAYRVDHPIDGGDGCLSLQFTPQWLEDLLAHGVAFRNGSPVFPQTHQLATPAVQLMAFRLRHQSAADPMLTEELSATMLTSLFDTAPDRTSLSASARRLVDEARTLLQQDPARRWSLSELAAQLGTSPVYVTQIFSAAEGLPLYRYQTRLRLARALASLADTEDLAALALDHGFASHSQFTAAFLRTYGVTPSMFRKKIRGERRFT